MIRRDEHSPAPATVREWRVTHPATGVMHRFEVEDRAFTFALELATSYPTRRDGTEGKPVRVDCPSGVVLEISARMVRGASR